MARINVSIPDDLLAKMRAAPDVNWSQVMREAARKVLGIPAPEGWHRKQWVGKAG